MKTKIIRKKKVSGIRGKVQKGRNSKLKNGKKINRYSRKIQKGGSVGVRNMFAGLEVEGNKSNESNEETVPEVPITFETSFTPSSFSDEGDEDEWTKVSKTTIKKDLYNLYICSSIQQIFSNAEGFDKYYCKEVLNGETKEFFLYRNETKTF